MTQVCVRKKSYSGKQIVPLCKKCRNGGHNVIILIIQWLNNFLTSLFIKYELNLHLRYLKYQTGTSYINIIIITFTFNNLLTVLPIQLLSLWNMNGITNYWKTTLFRASEHSELVTTIHFPKTYKNFQFTLQKLKEIINWYDRKNTKFTFS